MKKTAVSRLERIATAALNGRGASESDAHFLALESELPELMRWADAIRFEFFGNRVQLCSIINARSGGCSEDCSYCAQSARHEAKASEYPLLGKREIANATKEAREAGAAFFGIVTSGPSVKGSELDLIAAALKEMPNGAACASLGKLDEASLCLLKESGLANYHHNLETSESFFPSVCSTHDWAERVETVRAAIKVGLAACSGGLFGMGESWQDRISLAITLRDMNVRSVPINFLHPIPGTPLENRSRLSPEEALRIIALYRFILPKATIRICGGREGALRKRQNEIFKAGANGLMTGDYLTTAGVERAKDRAMIEELGLILDCR